MTTANRILLIEDEPDVADMLCFFLGEQGFDVHHAGFGLQGLSAARLRNPDLILLDSILPDIDGYSICRELRQMPATAHIPIIFLTRRSDRANRLAALELGADDFIAKPFDLTELLLRIRNTIQRTLPAAIHANTNGIPRGPIVREHIARAQKASDRAIVGITLAHTDGFVASYGTDRLDSALSSLVNVVSWTTAADDDCFVGMLADNQLVVIRARHDIDEFVARVENAFTLQVRSLHDPDDLTRGYLQVKGQRLPLLSVICKIQDHQSTARTG